MIKKKRVVINGKPKLQVTFTLPESLWADTIHLVGDFNGWDRKSHPFQLNREGQWQLTINLLADSVYQFRYLVDGTKWTSEFPADGYATGSDGIDSFVISTTPTLSPTIQTHHSLVILSRR